MKVSVIRKLGEQKMCKNCVKGDEKIETEEWTQTCKVTRNKTLLYLYSIFVGLM